MNVLTSLARAAELLPVDLLIEEVAKNGIEDVRVHELLGLLATCDVDTGVITLNPKINREAVARKFSRAWCCEVLLEHVYVAIFFHEVCHFRERDRPRKDPGHWEVRLEAEFSANDYARQRFETWKRGKQR